MKKLLKTGSYINFGFAALQYLFSGFTISISILFLVITGFIYLEFSKEEKTIIQNRNFLIVLGLISLFFNFITGIIVLIATDKKHEKEFLNSGNVKVKEEIDPSKKKIDILLKLGVGMVIVSGIIFATSSWDNIPDLLKFIFLVVLSVIFYGLYYFSFFKLQIKQSAFVYYMLTFLFIFFAYVSVGYYSLLGGWFSMHGAGMYLYYASVYLLLSIV